MLTSNIQLGRTKVLTRFEMFLRFAAALLALIGAAVSFTVGTVVVAMVTGADQVSCSQLAAFPPCVAHSFE